MAPVRDGGDSSSTSNEGTEDEYDEEDRDNNNHQKVNKDNPTGAFNKTFQTKGFNLSDSDNTDLYSTDEERSEHHQSTSVLRAKKKEDSSTIKPSSHCDQCRGLHKVPYIEFETSADGVQIHKRAVKCSAWPLMGQILYISPCVHLKDKIRFYMPRNSQPVIIGFFYGTTKPLCANQFLKCMFKEMKLLKKRGICEMFLKFYVGDGPSRQLIKGFPASNAYCGCER